VTLFSRSVLQRAIGLRRLSHLSRCCVSRHIHQAINVCLGNLFSRAILILHIAGFGNANNVAQPFGNKPAPQAAAFGFASAAPAGGLFGQQQQTQATGFGGPGQPQQQTTQNAPAAGLFGGVAQGSSTNAFGATTSAPTNPALAPQPAGLFGNATTQSTTTGTGLFGTAIVPPENLDEEDFEEIAPTAAGDGPPGDTPELPRKKVSESALAMTFTVDGRASVPSDGIAHQVLIAVLPFEADLTYVCVPRVEAGAYVSAEVKNTSEYRLLPGQVSVFLDEGFVSRTTIQVSIIDHLAF
jgi:hypothetical protein